MSVQALICTVGGSPEPIETMLAERAWDRVLFLCSDGEASSRDQGENLGERLAPGRYRVVLVPTDDLDECCRIALAAIDSLAATGPSRLKIVADYTGGTKTMSAGLVLAAFLRPDIVGLQVTTGQRSNLLKVANLTEYPIAISTRTADWDLQIGRLTSSWATFDYAAAETGFRRLLKEVHGAVAGSDHRSRLDMLRLVDRLESLRDLSAAYAAWDRFDHAAAADLLRRVNGKKAGLVEPRRLAMADALAQASRWAGPDAGLLLKDLVFNLRRLQRRGRYDDALARLYRVWEGAVQILLRQQYKFDTGKPNFDVIPVDRRHAAPIDLRNKRELGAEDAWRLHCALRPESAMARFFRASQGGRTNEDMFRLHRRTRSQSILAHGFTPISRESFDEIYSWTNRFLEALEEEAHAVNLRLDGEQLPTELPPI